MDPTATKGGGGGGGGGTTDQPPVVADLGHIAFPPEEFKVDSALEALWTQYTEENEEKYFRKYLKNFNQSWEQQVRIHDVY